MDRQKTFPPSPGVAPPFHQHHPAVSGVGGKPRRLEIFSKTARELYGDGEIPLRRVPQERLGIVPDVACENGVSSARVRRVAEEFCGALLLPLYKIQSSLFCIPKGRTMRSSALAHTPLFSFRITISVTPGCSAVTTPPSDTEATEGSETE